MQNVIPAVSSLCAGRFRSLTLSARAFVVFVFVGQSKSKTGFQLPPCKEARQGSASGIPSGHDAVGSHTYDTDESMSDETNRTVPVKFQQFVSSSETTHDTSSAALCETAVSRSVRFSVLGTGTPRLEPEAIARRDTELRRRSRHCFWIFYFAVSPAALIEFITAAWHVPAANPRTHTRCFTTSASDSRATCFLCWV